MKIRQNDQDEELLRRSAKGDEEAFTVLYRRHADVLYRFAFRMTSSSWGAEEIVQDVFMTLVREPGKYDAERGTLPAFLFGITRNKIMKYNERLPREISLVERKEDGSGGGVTRRDSFTPAMWAEQRERLGKGRAAGDGQTIEF